MKIKVKGQKEVEITDESAIITFNKPLLGFKEEEPRQFVLLHADEELPLYFLLQSIHHEHICFVVTNVLNHIPEYSIPKCNTDYYEALKDISIGSLLGIVNKDNNGHMYILMSALILINAETYQARQFFIDDPTYGMRYYINRETPDDYFDSTRG